MGVTRDGALYFGVRKNGRDISVTTLDLETGTQPTSPARPIRRFVGTNLMPDWSSDGRHLAYVSQRGFDPTNNNGRIIGIHDITTGEERELRPGSSISGLSPGRQMAQRCSRLGRTSKDVQAFSQSMLEPATCPCWSRELSVHTRSGHQMESVCSIDALRRLHPLHPLALISLSAT